jgi:hypothetical protein
MADIKRANYFTSEALEEQDFNDEQAYHLTSRRRHDRLLHTGGVVDGFDVSLVGGMQIRVSPGTAVDSDGREIVLIDEQAYALTTNAAGDAYLTIAYQEVFDPADQDRQGLGKFTRTTERPLLHDSPVVPSTDGSVILLARLNVAGSPRSINSIDTTVRTTGGARVAPNAINTPQLADGAVTLDELADEVKPLIMLGIDAIEIVADDTLKTLTLGETHSARTDNPHVATAAQIDARGGADRLVTQINAHTGIITRAHVDSTIVSGVVTFESIPFSLTLNELFSDEIDPGFGPGPVSVKFAVDDVATAGVTSSGDPIYGRAIMFRAEEDRTTGRFRIFAFRELPGTGPVKVRWFASRPTAGADTNVAVSVTVSPSQATLIKNATQKFTAKVNNTNNQNVTWSVDTQDGKTGTLSNVTSTSATYVPPIASELYHIKATSVLDPSKQATIPIDVNADVLVTVSPGFPTMFGAASGVLTATVINTTTTGVTWSIREGASGGALTVSGNIATYTPPHVPTTTTFHVDAVSVADKTKKGTAEITVPAVTVTLDRTSAQVFVNETLSLTAVAANGAPGVTWSVSPGGGSVSPASGSNTVTYTAPAPGHEGTHTVKATSIADPTKFQSCTITVPSVTIAISGPTSLPTGFSTTLTASIGGTSDHRATWSPAFWVSATTGSSTTFLPQSSPGGYQITATSVADSRTHQTILIDVEIPGGGGGGGGGGGDGGGGPGKGGLTIATRPGQFLPVKEDSAVISPPASASEPAPSTDETIETSATARSFVRPNRRPGPE